MITMKRFHYKKLLPLATIFLCILSIVAIFKFLQIRINFTNSMPIGLYQKVLHEKLKRGDIAAVCLPDNISKEGKKQGYLISGDCVSGTIPVLKRIIALPHDTVKLTIFSINVNGVSYYAPHSNEDHNHQIIKQFVAQDIYPDINNYWLYGFNDPVRSWDSRYYGGVPRSAIQGIYRPILTL